MEILLRLPFMTDMLYQSCTLNSITAFRRLSITAMCEIGLVWLVRFEHHHHVLADHNSNKSRGNRKSKKMLNWT